MKKKILGVLVGLLVLATFAVPVMAKTETPVTYTKVCTGMTVDWMYAGKSGIFHVLRSEQAGVVYEGDQNLGDPSLASFTYTMIGKMMANPYEEKQIWHFDAVWTSTTVNGGFKGKLNGQAGADSLFTVQGVLQGFGELKGQKLVVEGERQAPAMANIAIFTGYLITP